MAETTRIEWTDATWNPWSGCTRVSPGCDHCYAESLSKRFGRDFSTLRRASNATFYAPHKWKAPRKIFTCSMSDFFHRDAAPWLPQAWDLMRLATRHTFQVLTKRPGRAAAWWEHWRHDVNPADTPFVEWPAHIWLGTSVETQKYAPRVDVLARVPAPVRFVSAEPLLGPLDLTHYLDRPHTCICTKPDGPHSIDCLADTKTSWVIIGGESGPGARPMDLDWALSLVSQCRAAGIPVFVKQLGAAWARKNKAGDHKGGNPAEWPSALRIRQFPLGAAK